MPVLRQNNAWIFHAGPEFFDSARAAREHLTKRGFTCEVADVSSREVAALPNARAPVDVMAWYSHGGWDGPLAMVISSESVPGPPPEGRPYKPIQVDPVNTPTSWALLRQWFRRQVSEGALFVCHACHSAGSHRWETPKQRWVREVAKDMNVYAVGVQGSTSSADRYHAVALLDYAFDGTRAKQPVCAYAPGGEVIVPWRGWTAVRGPR